jgi:hypothetical protein
VINRTKHLQLCPYKEYSITKCLYCKETNIKLSSLGIKEPSKKQKNKKVTKYFTWIGTDRSERQREFQRLLDTWIISEMESDE